MMRRQGPQWIMITAENQPFGATLNTDHITNIRWQPQLKPTKPGEPLQAVEGMFEVIVALVDGSHTLIFDSQQKAQDEYFRLNNDVRGSVIDDTRTGGIHD